jgi:hypothetical protein
MLSNENGKIIIISLFYFFFQESVGVQKKTRLHINKKKE